MRPTFHSNIKDWLGNLKTITDLIIQETTGYANDRDLEPRQ
jgi:hypothetical protein